MRVIITLASILAVAYAPSPEGAATQYSPNCDLVAISYISINKWENGLLLIDFAWDRKPKNYATISGPISWYVVRHGPLVGGKFSPDSQVFRAPLGKQDEILVANVKPGGDYGVQICAETAGAKISDDIWSRAWMKQLNLSDPAYYDQNGGKSEENNSFLPQCNLVVGTFGQYATEDVNGTTMNLSLSWNPKQSSYDVLGKIDHYRIRHGPEASWGAPINESVVRYFNTVDNDTSITLLGVPLTGVYGVQICAMKSAKDDVIKWFDDAWLGSVDISSVVPEIGSDNDLQGEVTTTASPNEEGTGTPTPLSR